MIGPLTLMPFLIARIVLNNFNELQSENMKLKYGTLYLDLKLYSKLAVLFNAQQILRWEITIAIIILLRNVPAI